VQNNAIEKATVELHKGYDMVNKELFGGELPDVALLIQNQGRKTGILGWATNAPIWSGSNGEEKYEMTITAEYLNRPVVEIMETIIHEGVHIYNSIKNVKDTSRGFTYHNKRFKEEAERRGLNVVHHDKYGWANTSLKDETRALIETWEIDQEAFVLARKGFSKDEANGGKKKSNSIKWVCEGGCKAIVRSTKEVNVICGDCNAKFKKEEVEESEGEDN
jgi:hypothetical protein